MRPCEGARPGCVWPRARHGCPRRQGGNVQTYSLTLSTLIKVHAQLASLLLDLTYEVPLTSRARRHDSHKGLSTVAPPASQPHLLGRLSRNRTEGGTLPHPPPPQGSPGLQPLQILGCGGGARSPSITEATSPESQAIRREGRRPAHSPGSHWQDVRRSHGGHSYDLFKYSLQSIYFYTEVKMCTDNG